MPTSDLDLFPLGPPPARAALVHLCLKILTQRVISSAHTVQMFLCNHNKPWRKASTVISCFLSTFRLYPCTGRNSRDTIRDRPVVISTCVPRRCYSNPVGFFGPTAARSLAFGNSTKHKPTSRKPRMSTLFLRFAATHPLTPTLYHALHLPLTAQRQQHIAALTHAALGFLVEESGEKHVIEFYATNYVGSFLPSLPPPPPTPAPVTPPPTNASPTASPTSTSFSSAPVVTLAPAATRFTQQPTASLETPAKFALPLDRTDGHRGEVGDRWKDVGKPIAAVAVVSETGEGLMADLHKVAAAGNGTTDVTWDNTAAVRETSGFDPNLWVSANYVAKITGLLFNDLSGDFCCLSLFV